VEEKEMKNRIEIEKHNFPANTRKASERANEQQQIFNKNDSILKNKISVQFAIGYPERNEKTKTLDIDEGTKTDPNVSITKLLRII